MKPILLLLFIALASIAHAQKIDSISVNLYTDSLKAGTYNYINVDGVLANGRYIPLDSTQVLFSASAGKFEGNNLWVEPTSADKKIRIKVILKQNPARQAEFDMYIKQLPDGPLKTLEEVIGSSSPGKKKKH